MPRLNDSGVLFNGRKFSLSALEISNSPVYRRHQSQYIPTRDLISLVPTNIDDFHILSQGYIVHLKMSNSLHRMFEGELYDSWHANYQTLRDSDESDRSSQANDSDENEPQKWWVVFMLQMSDDQLTDGELLQKLLALIKDRDIYLSDVDPAGYHSLTFAFQVITMTNTDEDILSEAEIVVEDWIENFQGLPFSREDVFSL